MTHIGGSGKNNKTDRLYFKGAANKPATRIGGDKFVNEDQAGNSERGWSNPTFDVTSMMPGSDAGTGYGEEVVTTVDHKNDTPYDCLSWAAIAFSTTVLDSDGDGLTDRMEDVSGLKKPSGEPLPDLRAMGASSRHQDLFVEVGAMTAARGTSYGSIDHPVRADASVLTDNTGHSHLPKPDVLRMVGEAYRDAPILNPDKTFGIAVHFDVGPDYHSLSGYASTEADTYLVPAASARGGELIKEVACRGDKCQFPAYPGTVSFQIGYQLYRNAPVGDEGQELSPTNQNACFTARCRRRFDRNREGLFHYILYAHARGIPKSTDKLSREFHVPKSSSGVSTLPGSNVMVTLGLWDNFVGTSFAQASTTMHELGHNFDLWHGGGPATYTTVGAAPAARTRVSYEPTCKPNDLSVMSYLFQLHGLLDDLGTAHLDYSRELLPALRENAVQNSPLNTNRYRTAWFKPLAPGSLAAALGLTPATKYCSDTGFPAVSSLQVARIDGPSVGVPIDWSTRGTSTGSQDLNFDGTVQGTLAGFNEWANVRLNEFGSGLNMAGFSAGVDFGGGVDYGGGVDFSGGVDFGGGVDYGGGVDFGGGEEITAELAASLGHTPPTRLTACVIDPASPDPQCRVGALHRNRLRWELPNFGGDAVTSYIVYRVTGATVTAVTAAQKIEAGRTATGTTFTLDDLEELPNGQPFTYWVVGRLVSDADLSSPSNYATVVAVNNNPVAVADTPSTNEDTLLTGDVLANDADADSQGRFPTLVGAPAHAATFKLNPDGSFAYLPAANFFGTDTFTYRLAAGLWARPPVPVPVSGDSDVRTVTITVNPVNDPPSFTPGAPDTVLEDSGARSVAWATAIRAGPANETDGSCGVPAVGGISVCQQVVDFLVSNDNPSLFAETGQPKIAPNGTLAYTPAADANGTARVTVQAHDNGGLDFGGISTSAPQTFVVTVTPVNDVPSFIKGADQRVAKDSGPRTVLDWVTAISAGPADESTQALDFVVTTTNGTLFSAPPAIDPSGTLTYTAATGAAGVALVSVALHDDGGISNGGVDTSPVQTFTITVGGTILIYGPSLDTGTPVNEKTIAEAAGYVVTVKTGTEWSLMSTADFHSYNAIVFGDLSCSTFTTAPLSAAEGNRTTWSPAVTGPIVVIGTDGTYHRAHGTAPTAAVAETLTRNAMTFAASGTTTGMSMSLSCYYATVPSPATVMVLDQFGNFVAGKVDRSSVVVKQPSHPVMSGLTSASLSGWGDSVHEGFSTFPATWTVIAVETSGNPAEQPYIISNDPQAPPPLP